MWGGTFIATRMASQIFGTFTGASLRYFVALLFMIPMAWFQDKQFFRISRKQFFQILLLGATGIFAYSYFFFNGLKLVPASHGALIVALNPVFVMIISSIFDKGKVGAIKIVGMILSLIGSAIVISRGDIFSLFTVFTWGDAFMIGTPLSWSMYTYFAKAPLKTTTPVQTSTLATVFGFFMVLIFAPFETFPKEIPFNIWLAIFYLGICGSVLGLVWYYEGVKKLGPIKTSAFNNLIPIFAMILSVLILGETLHTYTFYGAAFVIGGVFLINRF